MGWKNKIIATLVAASLMAFSSLSHANGELENVSMRVYMNPVGAPLSFIEEDFTLYENRIFPLARDEALYRLEKENADLVIGGISYTKERAEKYDFTPIYFRSCLSVVYSKRHHPEIKSLDDLRGLKVGIKRHSTTEAYVKQVGAQSVPFDNNFNALFAVSDGRLDALIYDRPAMADFVRVMKTLDLAVTNDIFGEDVCQFAFAMPKNSRKAFLINETLEQMLKDGTVDAILKRWHAEKIEDLRKAQQ